MTSSAANKAASPRESLASAFLERAGFGGANREKLPGDASFRRYERLWKDNKSYLMMDAPPPKENVRPFIQIDRHLVEHQFSAPRILAEDVENGFLLLEDLGNDSYTSLLKNSPAHESAREKELYLAAMDVLIELHQTVNPAKVADYSTEKLKQECMLLVEWFLPLIRRKPADAFAKEAAEYAAIIDRLIAKIDASVKKLVLRDYHADNLMWLPERKGSARVGLLDFQDAVIGHTAYDVVSLLEDARRDVAPETVKACLDHYIKGAKCNRDDFMLAYALLGAQRNCKIVGIFSRLTVRDGKSHYLKYLPRVWGHLNHDVTHPALAELKRWLDNQFTAAERSTIPAYSAS